MAFNFLGSINSLDDFQEFQEFVEKEIIYIENKIDHISAEIQRYNELLDKFMVADLSLRSPYSKTDLPDKDWIVSPRQVPVPRVSVPDALNGIDVDSLKKAFLDNIKAKREKNEFKVKKIRDLIEQMNDDVTFLTNQKTEYTDTLNRISSRFNMPGFDEVQEFAKEDNDDIKNVRSDFGVITDSGAKQYMVTAINALDNSITFERSVPPVRKGTTFTLSGGNNNGVKTVVGFKSSKSVIVSEPLTQETPTQSIATFQ